jgi:hypothetical protein
MEAVKGFAHRACGAGTKFAPRVERNFAMTGFDVGVTYQVSDTWATAKDQYAAGTRQRPGTHPIVHIRSGPDEHIVHARVDRQRFLRITEEWER